METPKKLPKILRVS